MVSYPHLILVISFFCISCPLCSSAQVGNQAPTAQFDFFNVFEDLPFASFVNPLTNDTDPENDNLSWSLVLGPFNGSINVNPNGPSVYISDLNYNGPDFFLYEVCDNGAPQQCANGFAVIIVLPTNDNPVASTDTFSVLEDSQTILDIVANDVDADGDVLYTQVVVQPKHGQVNPVGNAFRYTPNPNYFGPDSFRYQLSDSSFFAFLSPRAWVRIMVTPVNDPPVANPDSLTFPTSDSLYSLFIGNDTDIENDSLYIAGMYSTDENIQVAQLSLDPTGISVQYVQPACGADTIFYVLCDLPGACDTGWITLVGDDCESLPSDIGLFPEGISPNGDGINDKLVFSWLDRYSPALLRVFNRWGNNVFESESYDNSWNGTMRESGEGLPDGSYFYLLKLSNGSEYIRSLIIQR
jgi:gliding motility-associated-like protein